MKDHLYFTPIIYTDNIVLEAINWNLIDTLHTPANGLFHYGMGITELGNMILYGGVVSKGVLTKRFRNLEIREELWHMNLAHMPSDFVLVDAKIKFGGGFSKIFSIGGEWLCLLNPLSSPIPLLLDVQKFLSYKLEPLDGIGYLNRTGFGISIYNRTNIIIIGGYNQENSTITPLDPSEQIIVMSLELPNSEYYFAYSFFANTSAVVVSSALPSILFASIAIMVCVRIKRVKTIENVMEKEITLQMDNDPKDSKVHTTDIMNKSSPSVWNQTNSSEKGAPPSTLVDALFNGLYIPGYKETVFENNFVLSERLAIGGFGAVYIGKIVNSFVAKDYNKGESECVIKIILKNQNEPIFLQELAMHEFFGDDKYFSKLVCYSNEPKAIIMRHYKLGNLKVFIFSKNPKENALCGIEYTLKLIISLSKDIVYAVNYMHCRGIIHNDIKPENILLDKDKDDPLFPVITDFGLVKVLNTADVVSGFVTKELKGFTKYYCAPEVLISLISKGNQRVSTPESDIYSVGAVLYELITRTRLWKKYDEQFVIVGGLPELKLKNIKDQWKDINLDIALNVLSVLIACLHFDPSKRPMLDIVHEHFCDLDGKISQ